MGGYSWFFRAKAVITVPSYGALSNWNRSRQMATQNEALTAEKINGDGPARPALWHQRELDDLAQIRRAAEIGPFAAFLATDDVDVTIAHELGVRMILRELGRENGSWYEVEPR